MTSKTAILKIEAPSTKALIIEAFNMILRPYLNTAFTERDRLDADGNVQETRNPAKDRLEYSLRAECNLWWTQLYGNTEDPRTPQQYSAMHNIQWAEERLQPLQTKLERGHLSGRDEERHATYLAAKDENVALYRYFLSRFAAARSQYETIIEKPWEYKAYTKSNPQVKNASGLQKAVGAISEDDPFFQAVETQRTSATRQGANETAGEEAVLEAAVA
jgi:hypothetical protein